MLCTTEPKVILLYAKITPDPIEMDISTSVGNISYHNTT